MKTNWQTKKLGDIVEISGGGTPPTSHTEYFSGDIPWFTPSEITSGTVSVLNNSQRQITEEAMRFTKVAEQGTVLLSSRATIGNIGIVSNRSTYNQGIKGITPKEELNPWYLAYWLLANKKKLEKSSYGTTFKELSATALKRFDITVPPFSTQQQIVGRLDAIRKLQELNNKEIEKAEELFNSFVTHQLAVSKDVRQHKFDDIAEFQYGLTAEGKDKGNYRLIRITDIDGSGQLRNFDKKFVALEEKGARPYTLKSGDLLVARTGATYGKFLLFNSREPSIFASYLIKVTFNPKVALSRFIWLFTRTESYWIQARKLVTGSGQPQFNANRIKQIEIPLPLLSKQREIVDKAEHLLSYSLSLNKENAVLNEFFESMLNKAMKGELGVLNISQDGKNTPYQKRNIEFENRIFSLLPKKFHNHFKKQISSNDTGYWQTFSEMRTMALFHKLGLIPKEVNVKTVKGKNVDFVSEYNGESIHVEVKGFAPENYQIAKRSRSFDAGEESIERALRRSQDKFIQDSYNIVVIADEETTKTTLFMNPLLKHHNTPLVFLSDPINKKTSALIILGGLYENQLFKFMLWYNPNAQKDLPQGLKRIFDQNKVKKNENREN